MKKLNLFFALGFLCFALNAQELSSTMTVKAGTVVYVSPSTALSPSELTLKSTSDSFSCLFQDGTLGPATIVNYDRYVNQVGVAGVNGGNDLISLPVKTAGIATFGEFLQYTAEDGSTTNADVIPNSPTVPTLYAVGPYNNTSRSYINYDAVADANVALRRGVGYRMATLNGQTVRFTGTVSTTTETVNIISATNYWNSIGNPYPTYIDSQAFLTQNAALLDPDARAIYGYHSGTSEGEGVFANFTIINFLTNTDIHIAPGQGFLVADNPNNTDNQITFTTAMRTSIGTDDFILGRNASQNQKLRLRAQQGSEQFGTEIYFNDHSTLGLDPGYDAALFDGTNYNFMLYSQLVENNQGKKMAIQSLGSSDLNDISIPLGLKAAQGQQVTFVLRPPHCQKELKYILRMPTPIHLPC